MLKQLDISLDAIDVDPDALKGFLASLGLSEDLLGGEGIDTNREFLLDLISAEDFVNQDHHTRWVEQSFLSGWQEELESKEQL